jgi:HEAT repeat protein
MSETASTPQGGGFAESLGELITRLRTHPDDRPACDEALDRLTSLVVGGPAVVEAGIENSWGLDGDDLKDRLLSRGVDAIRVSAGAPRSELLNLAQSLAADDGPLPSTAGITVEMIPTLGQILGAVADARPSRGQGAPGPQVPMRGLGGDEPPALSVRTRPGDRLGATLRQLLDQVQDAVRRGSWLQTLHSAQAVIRMLPGMPDDVRRGYGITLRRVLTRPVMQTLIDQAYRIAEERDRTVELLGWAGLDAAELILDNLRTSEAIGPKGFLVDALGGLPSAYHIVTPLLNSERWHEIRLAADLLGRMGKPEAIPLLLAKANHHDERVRIAVIDALSRFRDKGVVEALRQSLNHPSPRTRAQAGRALASRGSGAIAMPLLAALGHEKDPEVRRDLLQSLAGIDAPEASAALVRLATERRGLLSRGGRPTAERLEVVSALAGSSTQAARRALSRIVTEGDAPVREAAERALHIL